jgi:hypothetical protein
MTKRRGVVDLTPPFGEDPIMLRTTLFQGGGDDKDNKGLHVLPSVTMKEKVNPNFRTPPS